MYTRTIAAAVAVSLFSVTNAHFFINTPVPIPGSNPKDPLDPNGDNFPCHGATTGGTSTSMAAGSSQPLKFELGGGANTAVHGGGSCQISITYETDPAALKIASNWKVIHSFVGGCPTNALGNLDTADACNGSNSPNCVNQDFTFDIPKEVKNGDAILAWTWFNNVGNREMYMNCAKVSLTGGTGQIDSLPSMFTANIGNQCSTTEDFNLQFPDPGQYVTTASTLNYPLKAPVGTCPSGGGSGSSASTPSTPSPPSTGSGSAHSGSPAAAAPPAAASGGAFAEGASPATTLATQASAAPAAATGDSSPPPAAAPAPAAASAPAGGAISGSCTNGASPCSTPGFYCIDANTFGMCAFGCAVPQQVAAGTTCVGNAIAATKHKRHVHVRHARRRSNL